MTSFQALTIFCIFVVCSSTATFASKPIRAQCIVADKVRNRWQDFLELEPMLKQYGLEFVSENPDVILCTYVNETILALDKPIIILEKFAAASVNEKTRAIIDHPLVIAVFKNRTLKNKRLDNNPLVAGRYFNNIINEYAHAVEPELLQPLSISALKKIHTVVWDLFGSAFKKKIERLKDYTVDYDQERTIDIFFACDLTEKTSKSGSHILFNWHRSKAIEAMRSITGINCVALTTKIDYWPYINNTQNSKIVVSPWGFGEYCWRDFEAIHCGAILIKPDTTFIKSIPNIYQNNITYVPCKPDFSDLHEIVQNILNNYEAYTPMRKRAKEILVDSWNFKKLAKQFVAHVKMALKNNL